ncbi:MAG: hypothetical protein II990_08250 [Muribaculaceae bacterium]|nr:hypothetical protein [Muribaculaceae bacterium]
MTPQELDVALKDIRRTRNLMIFFGFMPILCFVTVASMMFFVLDYFSDIYLTIIPTIIFVLLLIWTIKKNSYLGNIGRLGLILYAIGFLIIFELSLFFVSSIISYVGGAAIYLGLIAFLSSLKVDKEIKSIHILFYLLILLVAIFHDLIALTIIIGIIYSMFSSYLAVRWANKEFFKLMNNEE